MGNTKISKKELYKKLGLLIGVPIIFLTYIFFADMITILKVIIFSLPVMLFGTFGVLFIPEIIIKLNEE